MKKITFYTAAFIAIISNTGCKKDPIITQPAADYKNVLINIGNDVILGTYQDLYDKNIVLVNTLNILQQQQTTVNLEAAKQAWKDMRIPWEQSEGFLFGPVHQQGIDPSIDSWPVNAPDLDNVLASTDALTKIYIDGLDGTLKGFHTIEYLLFGTDGNKPVSSFTPRQFEYLASCGQSLEAATQKLYYAWKPDKQNFIANVLNAGNAGNTFYPSQKSAIQEVLNGLIGITDEVANGKINDPFSQQNINLEESRFSSNSKRDFSDNIRSVRNAYLGTYKNATGLGIASIIETKNPTLNAKVKQEIEEAINAIESIQGTFTTAIFNAAPSVINAQQKVRTLQQTLQSEVGPVISSL